MATGTVRQDARGQLRRYIAEHGLRASRQRDIIAEVFLAAGGHLRVEELLAKVRAVDPLISQATVYRALKLFAACGLAEAHRFDTRGAQYETSPSRTGHHDHLICTRCGAILEFVDERIEALQRTAARRHGFAVQAHKLELYGLCRTCRRV